MAAANGVLSMVTSKRSLWWIHYQFSNELSQERPCCKVLLASRQLTSTPSIDFRPSLPTENIDLSLPLKNLVPKEAQHNLQSLVMTTQYIQNMSYHGLGTLIPQGK